MAHTGSGEQAGNGDLPVSERWLAIFEDRHGAGSYEQLVSLLAQPCVTFAEVATRFGVTRECVRQWHLLLMPDAPRGHARQQQCTVLRRRRRLLEDDLFRAFFRHARHQVSRPRIELLKATDGYRTRSVRIDNRLVAIAEGRRLDDHRAAGVVSYALGTYRGAAEFIYLRLTRDDYLFVPVRLLAGRPVIFHDTENSPHGGFKNSFVALNDGVVGSGFQAQPVSPVA